MPDIFTSKNSPLPDNQPIPSDGPKSIRALSSFCPKVTSEILKYQETDEKVLLFLRKHLVTNLPWAAGTIILLLIPFLLTTVNKGFSVIDPSSLSLQLKIIIAVLYYLIVFAYAFANFVTWYFNISLVTTERVVDIDYSDMVYKNISATKLTLVQDVSFTQIGFFASLFDYGDVLVQTAGTLDNFDFFKVPHPDKVVKIIEGLIGKEGL
ncbi:MAG: hypothetical protein M1289_01415 [Patescibacteria group bacterium]|nr:hypothetical protein [Patescibacteria group bacterium]